MRGSLPLRIHVACHLHSSISLTSVSLFALAITLVVAPQLTRLITLDVVSCAPQCVRQASRQAAGARCCPVRGTRLRRGGSSFGGGWAQRTSPWRSLQRREWSALLGMNRRNERVPGPVSDHARVRACMLSCCVRKHSTQTSFIRPQLIVARMLVGQPTSNHMDAVIVAILEWYTTKASCGCSGYIGKRGSASRSFLR